MVWYDLKISLELFIFPSCLSESSSLSTSLVFTRHVQEAGQASPSPTSSPEGPTSTASPRASTSHSPRVTPLLASQLLFPILFHFIFYWHTVRLPEELCRFSPVCIRTPSPAGTLWPLSPEWKTTQLSICGVCEVTSQNGGPRNLRELQGKVSVWTFKVMSLSKNLMVLRRFGLIY